MESLKKEGFFVNVLCNILVLMIMAGCVIACFVYGRRQTVQASNSEYNGTIYAGDKSSKNISLMINVYWGTEHLDLMIDILDKYEAKATFFVGGSWVKDNPKMLKKILDSGHEVGNHGTNHKEHAKVSYQDNLTEIQTCHEFVKHSIDVEMELFAPPGGSYNSNTIKAAEFLNYKTIMWTRDTIDWRDKNASLIYSRAVTNLSGGDLILMHPTAETAQALTNIVEHIKQQGFNLVTVSETLGLKK